MQLQQQLQRPPQMMPQQGYGYPPPGYGGPPPVQQQAPPPQQTSPWTEHFTPEGAPPAQCRLPLPPLTPARAPQATPTITMR